MGVEDDFQEFDEANSWDIIYQKIKKDDALRNCDVSLKDARRPEFKWRNRYRDVSPYDHSRIRLQRDEIDYINASLVEAPQANRSYILTQGPLQHTSGHFWLMVWEQNSKAVLMLNRVIERGRGPLAETASHMWLMVWEQDTLAVLMLNNLVEHRQVKCYKYFPSEDEDEDTELEMVYSEVGLKVSYVSEKRTKNYTIRTLLLTDLRSEEHKEVLQFHYTTWPDFGVPTSPAAFLSFLMAVRESGALDQDVGPPVIHCSAGIGRSGTFCLVDTCLVLIEQAGTMEGLDVIQVLMDMRQYRMGLIQTSDQLRFSYLAIIEGAKRILSPSPDSGFDDPDQDEASMEDNYFFGSVRPGFDTVAEEGAANGYLDEIPKVPPPPPPRRTPVRSDLTSPTENSEEKKQTETVRLQRQEGVEIRRRKREDRKKNTAEQLERMKRKQKEAEFYKERKARWTPYVIGISLTLLVGGILFYKLHYG